MAKPKSDPEYDLKGPDDSAVTYLLDAANDYEESILEEWLTKAVDGPPAMVRIRSSRRGKGGDPEALTRMIADPGTFLIPVRVLWMPPEREGKRSVTWSDLIKLGDPRDPRGLRARYIRRLRRKRMKIIAGTGATAGAILADHAVRSSLDSHATFVTRRAWRVLDLEERRLRGNRYKTARFIPEAIFSRREFKESIADVARTDGLSLEVAEKKAAHYLDEIAAKQSPLVIDLLANAIHKLYRQGYGRIRYNPDEVQRIASLGEEHPIVFLPSHRSNLDRLSLQFVLWENDLPPNHTAGGINLNFFPIGPLLRRSGVFFIRRSFRDNQLYKVVLQHYLDYLIEKRFSLEWYMEGGRSRSGRLLPPRMGLLNYVVDAQRRGKSDDVMLVPLSIAYDQIQDVPDYAREAQGQAKQKESVSWLFRAVRSMRRRYGDIHIRFAEPLSVASITDDADPEEPTLGVQKLAFEVMYRIGRVTPITPTAIVTVALLAARGSPKTAEELAEQCRDLAHFIDARRLPTTEDLDIREPGVASILEWLQEHENVSSHEALGRRVFWLTDEQMIRISYYRNVIVHFFIIRSIAEVAIATLKEDGEVSVDRFHDVALALRDLLKFEFFFPDKNEFVQRVSEDLEVDVNGWKNMLITTGPEAVIAKMGERVAGWALLPFLDAYQIIGDELESLTRPYEEKALLKGSLDRARMYRIEGKAISGESASQILFKSALALAANRELLEETPQVKERRADFAEEIRKARRKAQEFHSPAQ